MKRRELREHLFLMLFRNDFHESDETEEQVAYYFDHMDIMWEEIQPEADYKKECTQEERTYLTDKLYRILEKKEEIDSLFEKVATGWKINRIGKTELTIIRLAVYEMLYDEEIPVKVAINEAVELAKRYGEDSSAGFVNGILAKVVDYSE